MNIDTFRTQSTGTGGIVKVIGGAFVVVSMLASPTTSNANLYPLAIERTSATSNNVVLSRRSSDNIPSTARSILVIRQIANLTWDETAKLFGVTRRSVHLWANGRHLSSDQERKLNLILGILSSHQRLSPSLLREKLMASARPGTLYFDLLCNDELEVFQDLFSSDTETRHYSPSTPPIGAGAYTPQSPILLLDALQDRPAITGKGIAKKSVRLKRQVG